MRFGPEALRQCCGEPRFAEARFAGDQHDLAVARLGAGPAAQQELDLLVPANERGQRRSAQCLEPAGDAARPQYLPGLHRCDDALHPDGTEIAALEQIADQPAGAGGDDHRVRLGQGLQPGGEVRGFADNRVLLRRAFADQIADHHLPGGDPDADPERGGPNLEPTDGVDQTQPGADGALGIVFMSPRVAEINEHAVAHVFGDKAVEPRDGFTDGVVVGADDRPQILGVEAGRQRCRADHIAEHYRQLPTFGASKAWRGRRRRSRRAQGSDRLDQPAPVPDRRDADFFEVVRGQAREHPPIDLVVAECRRVALQPQIFQPCRHVHAPVLGRKKPPVNDEALVVPCREAQGGRQSMRVNRSCSNLECDAVEKFTSIHDPGQPVACLRKVAFIAGHDVIGSSGRYALQQSRVVRIGRGCRRHLWREELALSAEHGQHRRVFGKDLPEALMDSEQDQRLVARGRQKTGDHYIGIDDRPYHSRGRE
jgi:hypothetical protein